MSTEIEKTEQKERNEEANEKPIICFDATEYDDFELCNFRWHAFHHLRINPKYTESYFENGILLHYILELYYREKLNSGTNTVEKDKIEEIVEAGRIESVKFDLTLEELSATLFQFREYHRFYDGENIVPLYIEEPFMVLLHEDEDIKIYLSGKPDLIFRYGGNTTINVMDHKRMSRNTDYSPLRNQFMLYAAAIGTDTVIVNKVGFQKTLAPKDRFLRSPFVYSDEIIAEWKQDAIGRAREMVIAMKYDHYPRNRTSCEKWSGCYLQRYCTTKPRARDFLVSSGEYRIGKQWDVTAKLETEKKEKE